MMNAVTFGKNVGALTAFPTRIETVASNLMSFRKTCGG
jgi:hypothetical protein